MVGQGGDGALVGRQRDVICGGIVGEGTGKGVVGLERARLGRGRVGMTGGGEVSG